MQETKHIAIFASGTGSNALAIINYFTNHKIIKVALVVTNNADAGVLGIAEDNNIPSLIISRAELNNEQFFLPLLELYKVDFIALAGFLQLMPLYLVKHFDKRMVNIHPALLPKFGGKGMYGIKVHEAVSTAGETETGITIHYVTEHYDEGAPILQQKVGVEPADSPAVIAAKVLRIEHEYYPKVIEQLLS
jgi:phosphoribosylglycinamide formyltransferase-1